MSFIFLMNTRFIIIVILYVRMGIMKRFFFFFISLALFFVFPLQVHADNNWVIENFQSNIAIQQSGVVKIVETISVDFRDTPEHGIYRDVPYLYNNNGKQTYSDIHIVSVLQNNGPAQYTASQKNGYEEIKIGNPEQTIVGRNVYTITYNVTGIVGQVNNYDELNWNATGNDWSVPIEKAEATVTLPEAGIIRITCYEGSAGSQLSCQTNIDSAKTANFIITNELTNDEGLTIVVDYKRGLVPVLTATPPPSYWEELFIWPSVLPLGAIIFIGIGFIFSLWYRYGRDYWFVDVLFGTKKQKGKVKSIGAHETISVEITPPENLRPAEIGVLMDERADTLDVIATIIDLATRGYLTITEVPKKWMFGKADYLLTKTMPKKKTQELLRYEQMLLNRLFYRRRQVKLSSLKKTFYSDLKQVKQALYDDVVSKILFQFDPEKVRRKYFFIGTILFIGGVWWVVYGSNQANTFFGDAGLGCVLNGIVLVLLSRYMPRRTAYGRELYRRSKGYRLFIDRVEKYRQRYSEEQNMFNEVLPYAIVFGVTKKFTKQMQKMGIKPTQTNWYIGSQPFTASIFVGSVNDFSHSMSLAMTSMLSGSGGFSAGSSG